MNAPTRRDPFAPPVPTLRELSLLSLMAAIAIGLVVVGVLAFGSPSRESVEQRRQALQRTAAERLAAGPSITHRKALSADEEVIYLSVPRPGMAWSERFDLQCHRYLNHRTGASSFGCETDTPK